MSVSDADWCKGLCCGCVGCVYGRWHDGEAFGCWNGCGLR